MIMFFCRKKHAVAQPVETVNGCAQTLTLAVEQGNLKESQRRAKGKPKESERKAKGKPKESQRKAKEKPKKSQRKAKGKPKES